MTIAYLSVHPPVEEKEVKRLHRGWEMPRSNESGKDYGLLWLKPAPRVPSKQPTTITIKTTTNNEKNKEKKEKKERKKKKTEQ